LRRKAQACNSGRPRRRRPCVRRGRRSTCFTWPTRATPTTCRSAAYCTCLACSPSDPVSILFAQDPSGEWRGLDHFSALVHAHAQHYSRVMMVGSSMGGSAALMHARHAHEVIAFGPRVDLQACTAPVPSPQAPLALHARRPYHHQCLLALHPSDRFAAADAWLIRAQRGQAHML
jgi:hypothetical protein